MAHVWFRLQKLRQKVCEFKASIDAMRPCLKRASKIRNVLRACFIACCKMRRVLPCSCLSWSWTSCFFSMEHNLSERQVTDRWFIQAWIFSRKFLFNWFFSDSVQANEFHYDIFILIYTLLIFPSSPTCDSFLNDEPSLSLQGKQLTIIYSQ